MENALNLFLQRMWKSVEQKFIKLSYTAILTTEDDASLCRPSLTFSVIRNLNDWLPQHKKTERCDVY